MKFLSRSLVILFTLYGLLGAFIYAYLLHAHAPLWIGFAFPVVACGLQYVFAPRVITTASSCNAYAPSGC